MLAHRFSTLLCVSLTLAANPLAHASEPFVVQLRLPARGVVLDVFAARTSNGIEAPGSALASMGMAVPNSDDLVPLSSVPGLSFEEREDEGAIIISCTMACFERQHIDLAGGEEAPQAVSASATGGYINYEADVQYIDGRGAEASGIGQAALFGQWGLLESSWLGQTGDNARFTRLETSWVIDRPRAGIRARVGDSVLITATGAPMRFGGLQVGRYFGLTPSLITYPTPALSGEAESNSTVQLYVDGVLRAQSEVEAGPFVIDHAPVVSGGGEAQLVITDVLGRQQTITRPFFVSTTMLRQGLDDWAIAIGAERRDFGRESNRYGDSFAAVRYRRGITNGLTLEAAMEATEDATTAQAGVSVSSVYFGQAYVSHSANAAGGYTSSSWHYDGAGFSFGAQFEQREGRFTSLGRELDDGFRQAMAGSFSVDMGENGAVSFTAAELEFDAEPRARTLTFSYTPDFGDGMMSFRAIQTERDERDLSVGVSFSFALAGEVSGHASAEHDRRGMSYRASLQRAVEPDRLGWRARASAGASERVEVAAMARGALGDTLAEAGIANGVGGVRVRHAGSVGWIENVPFAGRRIDGGFALVDGGAPNVSVARNRLDSGETGADGRRVITNLQPYRANTISISADDLPLDRAPATQSQQVTVSQGAGALVRFTDAEQRIIETHIVFADGSAPPRGAMLTRNRDNRRFPIGSNGRIVIQGAEAGDVLALGSCNAIADEAALADGSLTLQCGAMS